MEQKVFEILVNEYRELSTLRERSIKNTEETTRTFITILGLVVAAFAISPENNSKHMILLFSTGFALLVGCFIYHGLISSNINQTIYTRELNMTRKFLIEDIGIENKIFLETEFEKPLFDNLGFINEKYSIQGGLGLVKIIICILIVIMIFLFFNTDVIVDLYQVLNPENLYRSIMVFIFSYFLLNYHHEDMLAKGKNKWCDLKKRKGLI